MGLKHGLYVADVAFAWFIVFPLGVFFWRGTWDIWDTYINIDCRGLNKSEEGAPGAGSIATWRPASNLYYDGDEECVELRGLWLSGAVGAIGCILINIMSPFLLEYVNTKRMHVVPYQIICKLYCYAMGFLSMGFWRGVWQLAEHYGEDDWKSNLIGLGASLGLAFVCRLSIQCKSLPWEIGTELAGGIFESGTWLGRTAKNDGWWLWSMDVALSQIFGQGLSIFIWRCIWNVMDTTIILWDRNLSAGVTLGAGLGGLLILVILHFPVARLSAKLDSKPLLFKLIVEDFWYLLVNGGTVLAWRGGWYLVAWYVIPDPVVGGWSCQAIGFVALSLLGQANSFFDNGVTIDGDEENGYAVKPKIEYFQYMFRKRIAQEEGKPLNGDVEKINGMSNGEPTAYDMKPPYSDNGFSNNAYDSGEKL